MERYVKENIERLLYTSGLTQNELADKANLSRQTVNKLLSSNEKYSPKLSTLIAISNVLLINFPELLIRSNKLSASINFTLNSVEEYQNTLI
ncbi:helix-turn-helix transcriptional regulator, partial [Streptococcus agalactiae]|nr:helix-turn-helix transcriptional regulator [Streptococcus agalactiae]